MALTNEMSSCDPAANKRLQFCRYRLVLCQFSVDLTSVTARRETTACRPWRPTCYNLLFSTWPLQISSRVPLVTHPKELFVHVEETCSSDSWTLFPTTELYYPAWVCTNMLNKYIREDSAEILFRCEQSGAVKPSPALSKINCLHLW